MIDPKYFSKSFPSSRIALAIALLLAGAFGLGVAFFVPSQPQDEKAAASVESLPVAQEASDSSEQVTSADIGSSQALANFCAENVTESRSFVVFRGGTCVVVDEPSTDPVTDARERLASCNEPDARFIPEFTREGNLIVSFKEPVFINFTPDEIKQLAPQLEVTAATLLTPAEKANAGKDWSPPAHAKLGLLARRRMLEDAARPVPVRIIRAKGRLTAEN